MSLQQHQEEVEEEETLMMECIWPDPVILQEAVLLIRELSSLAVFELTPNGIEIHSLCDKNTTLFVITFGSEYFDIFKLTSAGSEVACHRIVCSTGDLYRIARLFHRSEPIRMVIVSDRLELSSVDRSRKLWIQLYENDTDRCAFPQFDNWSHILTFETLRLYQTLLCFTDDLEDRGQLIQQKRRRRINDVSGAVHNKREVYISMAFRTSALELSGVIMTEPDVVQQQQRREGLDISSHEIINNNPVNVGTTVVSKAILHTNVSQTSSSVSHTTRSGGGDIHIPLRTLLCVTSRHRMSETCQVKLNPDGNLVYIALTLAAHSHVYMWRIVNL
jgi:hypothetical protein